MDRNIILLFGGDSDERLVSVASAQAMAETINPAKIWFWHHKGPIFDVKYDELIAHKNPFTDEFIPASSPIFNNITDAIKSNACAQSVFLLGVHGGSQENGELQDLLERYHRPFTGSHANASRLAFNKVATKECLLSYPIKLAPHVVLETGDLANASTLLKNFFDEHKEIIIKPVCGGSSLGCFYIRSPQEVATAIESLRLYAPKAFLAEKVIHGREITIGVFETAGGPIGLPCTEILLEKNRNFDYQGKYLGAGSKEITPADLSRALTSTAQQIAVTVHNALSLDGYSRADLILAPDGFYFLEINTLPGMSRQSLVPQQLAAAGISLRNFLQVQLDLACQRRF